MTQTQMVFDYMMQNGSISPMEAITELGVMRLASRIHDLRIAGVTVNSQTEKGKNRFGEDVHFTRYSLGV